MTATVRVSRVTDGLGAYRRPTPAADAATGTGWYVVWSPLTAGVWTAYKDGDQAVKHAHQLWLRYGATAPVTPYDELPS